MNVSMIKADSINTMANNYSTNSQISRPEELALDKPTAVNKSEAGKNQSQGEQQGKEELTNEEIGALTAHLNKFMKDINSDLHFELHEETKRMIVRFIDPKDGQVIKEFPPRELLDTLAAINDYIGFLLDKKV